MKNKGVSRRWFIGGAATGVVSAGLELSGCSRAVSQEAEAAEQEMPAPEISYRVLGRTGLKIPLISFGVMNSDNPDLLRRAFDLGLNHLDTAHGYLRGKSEQVIGEVVEQRGNRDSVYIATKMYFARDRRRISSNCSRPACKGSAPTTSTSSTFTAATAPPWPPSSP
jgi:hypothetical protein